MSNHKHLMHKNAVRKSATEAKTRDLAPNAKVLRCPPPPCTATSVGGEACSVGEGCMSGGVVAFSGGGGISLGGGLTLVLAWLMTGGWHPWWGEG